MFRFWRLYLDITICKWDFRVWFLSLSSFMCSGPWLLFIPLSYLFLCIRFRFPFHLPYIFLLDLKWPRLTSVTSVTESGPQKVSALKNYHETLFERCMEVSCLKRRGWVCLGGVGFLLFYFVPFFFWVCLCLSWVHWGLVSFVYLVIFIWLFSFVSIVLT